MHEEIDIFEINPEEDLKGVAVITIISWDHWQLMRQQIYDDYDATN